MARRGRKPCSAALAGVMILLSETASAKVVALSSVEAISSASIICKTAYNAPMLGCSVDDFSKKSCSRLCLRSIDKVQAAIQTTCGSTAASENSLLSRAQRGGLSSALCGTGSGPDQVSSSVTITTSRSIFATLSSATPTLSSTPSVTRTTAPTLLPSSTTPITSIAALPSSSRASPEPTVNPRPSPLSATRETARETNQETALETSTSSEALRPTPPPGSGGSGGGGSGGGSPFDFIAGTSPASKNQSSVMGIFAGWALAALLVQ